MNIENARIAVTGAVKWAVQHGRRIVPGLTAGPDCCCPMGAVALMAGLPMQNVQKSTIAEVLGVSQLDVGEFMTGFDGMSPATDDITGAILSPEWYHLGREFRAAVDAGEL